MKVSGAPYLDYPMELYFYSKTNEKTVVLQILGNRVGLKLNEFIQLIGEPDDTGESAVDDSWYALYQAGKNKLWVTADSPTGRIYSVRLFADKP